MTTPSARRLLTAAVTTTLSAGCLVGASLLPATAEAYTGPHTYEEGSFPPGCEAHKEAEPHWHGVATCTQPLPDGALAYQLLVGCPGKWVPDGVGRAVEPSADSQSVVGCNNREEPDRLRIRTTK